MKEISAREIQELTNNSQTAAVFFYTPLCGTCQVASEMTGHIETVFDAAFLQADINTMPDIAQQEQISSVPCLKVWNDGRIVLTIYAFESVPSLLKRLHGLVPLKGMKEDENNDRSKSSS
ncbi:thioredoxin family protein [Salibacterium halotolerans]|uniref:Thioredoxin n=1 Tax=Salibacterium halotolerans TaxID=1884432 RepID=A0A1I5QBI8_9BACI|nr:thioredoxin family protein [Salibacterium halotolerans]SFP43401.1 Thioredoxin [Salibacterium halotolerans]